MKVLIIMTGLALASTTLAQTWDAGDGKLTLVGCYGKQDGVYCDLNYILTKKQTQTLTWDVSPFKLFNQDGAAQYADGISFGGGDFVFGRFSYTQSKEIIANVPVKLQLYFNVPSSVSFFKALAYNDARFDNVAVRPYGSISTTPADLPAGSNIKGFAISLSNCQLQGQNYVCVATLTPSK